MSFGHKNLWMIVDDGPLRQLPPWMMKMIMPGWVVQLHAWWACEWHLELAALPPLYKQKAEEQQTICRSYVKCAKIAALLSPQGSNTEWIYNEPTKRVQWPRNNFWSEMFMDRPTHVLWVCPQTQLQSPMSYGNCDRNLTVGDLSTRVF